MEAIIRMNALTAITLAFDPWKTDTWGKRARLRVEPIVSLWTPFNDRKFPPFVSVDRNLSFFYAQVQASWMSRTKAPIQDNVPERAAVQNARRCCRETRRGSVNILMSHHLRSESEPVNLLLAISEIEFSFLSWKKKKKKKRVMRRRKKGLGIWETKRRNASASTCANVSPSFFCLPRFSTERAP